MRIRASVHLFFLLTIISSCSQEMTKNVDPFIGTGGHGHTFPGATLPFGMVQLSPDTGIDGWDWCSGYHASDTSIMGFSHTHLSGTGRSDLGDILLMPTTGQLKFTPGSKQHPDDGYRSRYDHKNEHASPGYYSVLLDDYNITAELTTTQRVGFHKYTFPKSDSANIIIDLGHGIRDRPVETEITFVSDTRIEGFRKSRGWAKHSIFFTMEFSKPFKSFGIMNAGDLVMNQQNSKGQAVKGFVSFETKEGESILVKVALSAVSVEGATLNLTTELPAWNFEKTRENANSVWNDALSKITVEGGTENQRTIFYTSMYHAMIHPNTYFDVDGKYKGMDQEIHDSKGAGYYSVFSLWDTYRALHPLLTIIQPKKNEEFVDNFISKYYAQTDILPKWAFVSDEVHTMIGYHSVSVIFDAYMKGARNFDVAKAFEAMKNTADINHDGIDFYKTNGYVASDLVNHRSVSKTLEYAYDDWCIAMMAKELGHEEDFIRYMNRATNYKKTFNSATGFMQARNTNGNWVSPLNPYEVSVHYTEANAWQYSFYVPHDVQGLIDLYGGKKALNEKLDTMFTDETRFGEDTNDVTGLIGQYAHGNEPSHHMAYLYNYTGKPWKTQKLARKIIDELYTSERDGLSGNEDCGQMSAWYVFSAMGFYPVSPGTNEYGIGSPIFDKVTIKNDTGQDFVIKVKNASPSNHYIQSATLDGVTYTKNFFTHADIVSGKEIVFEMGPEPNKTRGIDQEDLPYSLTKVDFVSTPYLKNDISNFDDSALVALTSLNNDVETYYTVDGSEPDKSSQKYTAPFTITETTVLKAKSYLDGFDPSMTMMVTSQKTDYRLRAGVTPKNLQKGIRYTYYEEEIGSINEINGLKPVKEGIVDGFTISPAETGDGFSFRFEGFIRIKESGTYRFYTQSDDGSALFIGDKKIVNNDGPHGTREASGTIALQAGYHPIKVLFFEDLSGQFLEVFFESKKMSKRLVSNTDLFYSK